jgi:hypothetical protein
MLVINRLYYFLFTGLRLILPPMNCPRTEAIMNIGININFTLSINRKAITSKTGACTAINQLSENLRCILRQTPKGILTIMQNNIRNIITQLSIPLDLKIV